MAWKLTRLLMLICGLLVAAAQPTYGQTEVAAPPKIVMYATDWCPYCAKARAHFRKLGIDYVEHDIEKSPEGRAEYQRLGGRGVPLILIGEQRMSGFSEARFDSLYGSTSR